MLVDARGGGSSLYAIILDVSLVLLGGINSVAAKLAVITSTTHASSTTKDVDAINARRTLQQEEDFSTINTLLLGVSLHLPNANVAQSGLDLTISKLTCSSLQIDDMTLSHTNLIEEETNVKMMLDVAGLSVECTLRWD